MTDNSITIIEPKSAITDSSITLFNDAIALTLKSVSETSSRVYQDTFKRWIQYCESIGASPLDLTPGKVYGFLEAANGSKSTLQRKLSALRSLTRMLAVLQPEYLRNLEALKIVNTKQLGTNSQSAKRPGKALRKSEIYDAMHSFEHDTLVDKRNTAILAVAFYAGLRRAEIAALRWADIDLERGMITIRNGKGKKDSTDAPPIVPLLGDGAALDILKEWRATTPADRVYVFTGIRRGNHFGADKPITGEAIRLICADAGDFKPHDARRTLITGLLNAGTPLHVAQAQARHASGQTTLGYAKVADAEEIKGRAKLDY